MSALAEQAVARTPRRLVARFRGMSDRAIAWLFIAPTVLLLLAINIFPLLGPSSSRSPTIGPIDRTHRSGISGSTITAMS